MAKFQRFLDEFATNIIEKQIQPELRRLEKEPEYVDGRVVVQVLLSIRIMSIDESGKPEVSSGRLYLAGERDMLRAEAEGVANFLNQGDDTEPMHEIIDSSVNIDEDAPLLRSRYKPSNRFPGLIS